MHYTNIMYTKKYDYLHTTGSVNEKRPGLLLACNTRDAERC